VAYVPLQYVERMRGNRQKSSLCSIIQPAHCLHRHIRVSTVHEGRLSQQCE
jgi:hypothetical protein